jgi:heptaprenyl diphosphate synthase
MRGYWDNYPQIKKDLDRVSDVLGETLRSKNTLLSQGLESLLARKGKMLRPAFVVLSARMKPLRGKRKSAEAPLPDKMYRIAAAMEIMHLATLVHDDIIDRADTRRGAPSLNAEFGDRRAVLIGDYLFSRCFSLVADYADIKTARFLASGVAHICGSEISQSGRFDFSTLTVRDYLHRIIGKTAVLFTLSFHVGASENGLPETLGFRLRRIGYNIGLSFQITDDLLDYLGNEKDLGKKSGEDLRGGIFTLPLIYAFREDPEGFKPLMTPKALSEESGRRRVIEKIEAHRGFEKARLFAAKYTERALRETECLPASENRRILVEVIRGLLSRRY